jgi:peptide/nickel transport system substrate-binding protein
MLFDKQEFLQKKMHGAGVVVSGSQYYFGPAYDHTLKPLAYDPQVARDLLADAGWVDTDGDGRLDKDGKPFTFTLYMPQGSSTAKDMMQVIQRGLKDVGIEMDVRETEWASFVDKLKQKDFDAVTLSWAGDLESDPYQIWHSSGADPEDRGSNAVSFADPQADKFIEQIRVTLDKDERMKAHAAMQRILDREQPYMFLYTSKDFGAYHQRFHGVKWYVLRPGFDFREWYVPKKQQAH